MRISRLRLQNWKNFQKLDVNLEDRVFIIGPNAAGKSNLLDALRFLRDVCRDGLRSAVDEKRGGVSALRCLAARRKSEVEIEFELRSAESLAPPDWRYVLAFTQDNNKRVQVTREEAFCSGEPVLQRPDEGDEEDPQRRSQTALEQISLNKSFRPIADFLESISYQHLVPQAVRDSRGFSSGAVQNDPFGRDFLLRIIQTNEKTRRSRLEKIRSALSVAVPQLKALEAEMDKSGVPHLWGDYEHWRPNAAKQNEAQFSDGTIRLIGLLWSIFDGTGPLLLEEPEISLHPAVVAQIPRMIAKIHRDRKQSRQVFVSTHSDQLLSDPGIALEEVLLLVPSFEGTTVLLPDRADRDAVDAGLSVAEVMIPKASPRNVEQLVLAL